MKKEAEEREEMIRQGIDPDRRRKNYRKKQRNLGQNGTALEAIEKVVQERKISTKINYEVLANLSQGALGGWPAKRELKEESRLVKGEQEEHKISKVALMMIAL